MNNLEEYIRENAARLDTALTPESAEEMFLLRWEAGQKSRKRRIFFYSLSVAAAVALLAVLPWKYFNNSPNAVYSRYLASVADAWELVGENEEAAQMLSSLTYEAVPLADQLPEDLSPREQAEILNAYYGELLEGVNKIVKTIK